MSSSQEPLQPPHIDQGSVLVTSNVVEEYLGIRVFFAWAQPPLSEERVRELRGAVEREFAVAAERRAERARQEAKPLSIPQPMLGEDPGDDFFGRLQQSRWGRSRWSAFLQTGLVLSLLQEIRRSEGWSAFYQDPERHIIHGQLDGTGERWGEREIPLFRTEQHLLMVELSAEGGEITFLTRDA